MSRDTNTRPRPRRRYSMTQHGQSTQTAKQGNYLLKPSAGCDMWSPAYNSGVTTIRVLPVPDPYHEGAGPAPFDPYRFPAEDPNDPLGFGDWVRRYPALRNMGDPGITCIIADPADEQIVDAQSTPGYVLYNNIKRAIDQGQERPGWGMLMKGGRNRGAQLPKPGEVYLVQCFIMQYKSKPYPAPRGFSAEEQPIVMELGTSAGNAMLREFRAEYENYQGDPNDFESRYLCGDPISLHAGRFVNFYTLAEGDPRQFQQQGAQQGGGWNQGGQSGNWQQGGNQREEIGYGCFCEPQFNGIPATLADFEQVVRSKVKPWDEIVNVMSIEQQAQLLADKFPPDVIMYGWADYPD